MEARKPGFLRRYGWLLAAAALLALAAWLMQESPEPARDNRAKVEFPRYPRADDLERQARRRTLPPAPRRRADAGVGGAHDREDSHARRDPMHVAIADGEVALVIEANAIRESPVGQKLLACMSADERNGLDELEDELGVDVVEDIDRIALSRGANDDDGMLVVSGDFSGANWDTVIADRERTTYGDSAMVYGGEEPTVAVWNDEMVLVGSRAEVERAIDRLEGHADAPPSFPGGEAYGEIYGIISGESMAKLVPEELRPRMRAAADRVMLHVDTRDDVVMVADVYGDGDEARDLATAIGAALAVARASAVHEGDQVLAELLDLSKVSPDPTGFRVEMALPLELIEEQLGQCAR